MLGLIFSELSVGDRIIDSGGHEWVIFVFIVLLLNKNIRVKLINNSN